MPRPRQRNAYFSSSDAAFPDRYRASAEWPRVKAGTIAVDGGWRIYSSGPGLYTNLLLSHAFGIRRRFGERVVEPVLPPSLGQVSLEMTIDGRQERWDLSPRLKGPPRPQARDGTIKAASASPPLGAQKMTQVAKSSEKPSKRRTQLFRPARNLVLRGHAHGCPEGTRFLMISRSTPRSS